MNSLHARACRDNHFINRSRKICSLNRLNMVSACYGSMKYLTYLVEQRIIMISRRKDLCSKGKTESCIKKARNHRSQQIKEKVDALMPSPSDFPSIGQVHLPTQTSRP